MKIEGSPIPIAGEDYKLNLPKKHLSFSQIDLYLRCPERYYYQYVRNLKFDYGSGLALGACWDAVTQASGTRYIDTGKHLTKSAARKVFHEAFDAEEPKVSAWLTGPEEERDMALGFLEKFWSGPLAQWKPISVQEEISLDLAGVPVIGFLDSQESDGTIIDFKMAKDARYYSPESDLQMQFYALAKGAEEVAYWLCEKKSGKIKWLSATLSLEKVRWLLTRKVAAVAYAISQGIFHPVPNQFLCSKKWCPYWLHCAGQDDL